MDKKLTLNINEELIEFAHSYSKKTNQSISSIIENYLLQLKTGSKKVELPSKTLRLYGTLRKDIPDKKSLRKLFYEKSTN